MHRRWWPAALILFYIGMALWMKQQAVNFLGAGDTRYAVNLVGSLVFTISGTIPFLLGRRRASQPTILTALIVAAFAGFWLVDYPRSLEKLGIFLISVTLVPVAGTILFVVGHVTLRVAVIIALVSAGFIGALTAVSLIDAAAALYATAVVLIIVVLGYILDTSLF